VQPTRNAPTFRELPDGLGNTLRAYNPDTSGSLVLLIDAESAQHQILIALAGIDRATRVLRGPLVVWDGNTKAITYYNNASIATVPDVPKGVAGAIIPWKFNFESITEQPLALGLGNIVGD
jgi:hypothetical protein